MNHRSQSVLSAVKDRPNITAKGVAERVGIDHIQVSKILNKLMADGMVKRNGKRGMSYKWISLKSALEGKKSKLDKIPVKDRFRFMGKLTDMVIQGVSPSLIVSGDAGVGKTYTVQERLQAAGLSEKAADFTFVKGHSSPLGLYKTLHENSAEDQLIVFDDCDSVFKDPISQNILKAALDSYDTRTVSWCSQAAEQAGLPTTFEFKGKIVFISNLQEEKIPDPVRSRCFCANVHLSRKELIDRMRELAPVVERQVSSTLKKQVLDHMEKHAEDFRQFTLRTFIKALRVAKACPNDWKQMITLYA